MKKVYLAGPMRGLPNFNANAFRVAAEELRAQGYDVFSPVEHSESLYGSFIYSNNPNGDETITPIDSRRVFGDDCNYIARHADIVALLPGWENSRGARAEYAIAIALDLEIIKL